MTDKKPFDDFDEFADDYRAIHGKQTNKIGVDSEYFSELKIQQLRAEEGAAEQNVRILDFGCGDGIAEKYFPKYFPKAQITGIDVSIESIEIARKKNYPDSDFELFNGTRIPFEDNSFDIIFVSMVLHHIDANIHEKIFTEFKRVLKPGSRLYIFEHNPLNPVTRYFVNTCEFDKDARLVWPYKLKQKLGGLGFKNTALRFTFFFPRVGFLKKITFLENHLKWFFIGGQYYIKTNK